MSEMFEVIWSYFYDRYIVRPVSISTKITPLFVGSYDECVSYLTKCSPHYRLVIYRNKGKINE